MFRLFALLQTGDVPDPNNVAAVIRNAIDAAKGGEWSLFVSLLLMIVVFLVTKIPFIRNWLPKEAKPWVAAGAAVVLSIAVTAATSGNWGTAVLNGLVTGAAASGFWELVGKKILNRKSKEDGSK